MFSTFVFLQSVMRIDIMHNKKTKDDREDTTDLVVDWFNQSAYFPYFAYFAYGEVSDLGYN